MRAAALLLACLLALPGCGMLKGKPTNPQASRARTARWAEVARYGSSGPRLGGPRYRSGGCRRR